MGDESGKVEFQFVNSTIDSPTVPQDHAVRALIRKQAMKKASAARKRNGTYGRNNLRQFPVFVYNESVQPAAGGPAARRAIYQPPPVQQDSSSDSEDSSLNNKELVSNCVHGTNSTEYQPFVSELALTKFIPSSLPHTSYELLSMKYGINILDLSNLTTFHVGRATRKALLADPSQVVHLLRYNQWSFFSYLPSSYESSAYVKYATDCVVARVRQILSPNQAPIWDPVVISYYVKALNALQKALDCPKTRFKPEVLYAIEILALYELLAPSEHTGWVRHAAGAAHLIQLRGPHNYTTEFEKALFMAHVGAIQTEAMLNNERCFLEEECWQDVFQSIIVDNSVISDRSRIVISLLSLKSHVAGICLDATNAICNSTAPDIAAVQSIHRRASQLRSELLIWRVDNDYLLGPISEICTGDIEDDKRCKVIGVFLSCLMIVNRILACVSPSERLQLEDETQALVREVFALERNLKVVRPEASIFLAQAVAVSKATEATADDWRQMIGCGDHLIEREKFERWGELVGREI